MSFLKTISQTTIRNHKPSFELRENGRLTGTSGKSSMNEDSDCSGDLQKGVAAGWSYN